MLQSPILSTQFQPLLINNRYIVNSTQYRKCVVRLNLNITTTITKTTIPYNTI